MIYELNNKNSLSLYHFYKDRNSSISFAQFNKALFSNEDLVFSKTFIDELEGRVVAFIKFGRDMNNDGHILQFYYEKGFERSAKELLFRATSFFYMFHIENIDIFNEKDSICGVKDGTILYAHMEDMVRSFSLFKNKKFLVISPNRDLAY